MQKQAFFDVDNTIYELSDDDLITSEEDLLNIFGKLYPRRKLLIHFNNLSSEFFDLSSGLAGDILQKLVNYRVITAFVVDSNSIKSVKFKEMVNEANTGTEFRFFNNISLARTWLENIRLD